MTQRQFRRLTREELIEIIYTLQKKQAQTEQENAQLRQALSDRQLKIENAGSIAEASLALNGVFEAAQAAADQYLAQIRAAAANAQESGCAIAVQAQEENNSAREAGTAQCVCGQA